MTYEYAIGKRVDGKWQGVMGDVTYKSYDDAYDDLYGYQNNGRGYDGYTVNGLEDAKRLVERLELEARTSYDVVRRPLPTDWEDCYE